MKKLVIITFISILFAGYLYFSCNSKKESGLKAIANAILDQVDSFSTAKDSFVVALKRDNTPDTTLQQLFLQLRLSYKKMEWAIEYFTPTVARQFNGPPVEEIEAGGMVLEPTGLQVIETFLFPKYAIDKKEALLQQVEKLSDLCNKVRSYFENIDLLDWQIFDASKLEVFRIESLGITGFDNPLTLRSMQESAIALQSVETAMNYYVKGNDSEQLSYKFSSAIHYLQNNPDFNSFNRAYFIIHFADPVTAGITHLEKRLKIPEIFYNRLLNQDTQTLFDTDAFNANAFATYPSGNLFEQRIALGKILFADGALSGNGKRSCQSCHQPDKAFTDGLVTNMIINTHKPLQRNTSSLLNAALQPAQFYDLRVRTLEQQVVDVINNKNEMDGSLLLATKKLWQNEKYKKIFTEAFPEHNRNGIDSSEIIIALTSYVRSLVALNSPFDGYMRGDKTAMTTSQVNGFNLFMGKAKCATCHYMPLFNGTFPPRYMKTEAEVIGVPQTKDFNVLDSDQGQYNIIRISSLKHAFKTPSLRNATLTAPYMHNGIFSTLEEVIDFYNKGGGSGHGLDVPNQTLPFHHLGLSPKEESNLIDFIKSLTSK